MSGATSPFPQHAFMAWCSVKRRTGNFYNLYFSPNIVRVVTSRMALECYAERMKEMQISYKRLVGKLANLGTHWRNVLKWVLE
jgi:hypothetical protein